MPRFRPRFSLLTALLLTTIVGLAIVVALQWREVMPLRAEVRQKRHELGQLWISDDTVAQAIRVYQPDSSMWRWRVYLPPGSQYRLREWTGLLPGRAGKTDSDWLHELTSDLPVTKGRGRGVGAPTGEFTLDATLVRQENGWRFETHPVGGASVYRFQGDWPASGMRIASSGVPMDAQRTYEPSEPILLLHLSKPVLTPTTGGGTRSEMPTDPTEGIVLWLEQQPPGTTATPK